MSTELGIAKPSLCERKNNNFSNSPVNNNFRRSFKRMVSLLPQGENWGVLDVIRVQVSYKCFGVELASIQ